MELPYPGIRRIIITCEEISHMGYDCMIRAADPCTESEINSVGRSDEVFISFTRIAQ